MRYLLFILLFSGCISATEPSAVGNIWHGSVQCSNWSSDYNHTHLPFQGNHNLQFTLNANGDSINGIINDLTDTSEEYKLWSLNFHGHYTDTLRNQLLCVIEFGIGSERPAFVFGYFENEEKGFRDTEFVQTVGIKNELYGAVWQR